MQSARLMGPDDLPGNRNAARDIVRVEPDCTIHEVVGDVAGCLILPDQIRHIIIIEIGHVRHPPAGKHTPGKIVPTARPERPVHIPDKHIPRLAVLPDQVGFAIPIEVAYCHGEGASAPIQSEVGGCAKASRAVAKQDGIGAALDIDARNVVAVPRDVDVRLAAVLGWPQATFISKIEVAGDQADITREVDGGLEKISVRITAGTVGILAQRPDLMAQKK